MNFAEQVIAYCHVKEMAIKSDELSKKYLKQMMDAKRMMLIAVNDREDALNTLRQMERRA
jgi:hypothetical protein